MSWCAIMTTGSGPTIINTEQIIAVSAGAVDPLLPAKYWTAINCGDGCIYDIDCPLDEAVMFLAKRSRESLTLALKDYKQILNNMRREPADAAA